MTRAARWFTGAERREAEAKARVEREAQQRAQSDRKRLEQEAESARRAQAHLDAQAHAARAHAEQLRSEQAAAHVRAVYESDRPLLAIHTATGGWFYARRQDWLAAREKGDVNLALCTFRGDPIDSDGQTTLRMTTVEAGSIYPVKIPSATESVVPNLGRNSRSSGSADTAETRSSPPRPPRELPIIGDDSPGRWYLVQQRKLDPTTVDAFAHSMVETPEGVVVGVHNQALDGEERGEGVERFHGRRDNRPGRGRGLYVAAPYDHEISEQLILADNYLDALSAWELYGTGLKVNIGVASTDGIPSEAGKEKLVRTLNRMFQAHGQRIKPVLVDAAAVGERDTAARAAWLRRVATAAGAEYRRLAPQEYKNWNEQLQATKAAQEAARNAEEVTTVLTIPEEPETTQENPKVPRPRPR